MILLLLMLHQGPPYYQRPVDPEKDMALLQEQIAGGPISKNSGSPKLDFTRP